jgi:hypothetical protein
LVSNDGSRYRSEAEDQWPLLLERPGSSWFASVLGAASQPGRLAQLPADVLIGLPLAVAGRLATGVRRLRHRIAPD